MGNNLFCFFAICGHWTICHTVFYDSDKLSYIGLFVVSYPKSIGGVTQASKMKQYERQKFQKLINRRTAILGGLKFSLFAALAGRVYFLQVEEAEKYRTLAENNQFNFELLPPIRGRILDRNGIPLATNKDNFRLEIVSEQTKDVAETLLSLIHI